MLNNIAIFIPSKQSLKHALPAVKASNLLFVALLLCMIFSGYLPFAAVFGKPIIPFDNGSSFLDYAILFPLILLVLLGAPLKLVRIVAIAVPALFIITNFETAKETFNLVVEYLPQILNFSNSKSGSDFGSLASSMVTIQYGLFVYLAGIIGYLLVIIGFRYKENGALWNRLFLKDDATLVNRATFTAAVAWIKTTMSEIAQLISELKSSDKAQAKEKIKTIPAKKMATYSLFCGAIIAFFIYLFSALLFSPKMEERDVKQAIKDTYTQVVWGVKTTVIINDLSISSCEQYSDSPIGMECHIKATIIKRRGMKVIETLHVDEKESFQLEGQRWVYYD